MKNEGKICLSVWADQFLIRLFEHICHSLSDPLNIHTNTTGVTSLLSIFVNNPNELIRTINSISFKYGGFKTN